MSLTMFTNRWTHTVVEWYLSDQKQPFRRPTGKMKFRLKWRRVKSKDLVEMHYSQHCGKHQTTWPIRNIIALQVYFNVFLYCKLHTHHAGYHILAVVKYHLFTLICLGSLPLKNFKIIMHPWNCYLCVCVCIYIYIYIYIYIVYECVCVYIHRHDRKE